MTGPQIRNAATIDAFRNPDGMFTMVAVDQRESLRHMLRGGRDAPVDDDCLVTFKATVAEAVGGIASGILLDRQYGLAAAQRSACPVILAADILSATEPGGPMDKTELDDQVDAETVATFGASALKFLLPWHPARRSEAVDLAHAFMARCRELGLPGVLEGVIRPRGADTREEFADALVAAAADLSAACPDLYKTEVVYTAHTDRELATATALSITETMGCPWVVLSSGVRAEHFPAAAAAAAAGGARGFLAGRAVWGDATAADDPRTHLREHAASNLLAIAETVRAAS
ncbi:MAG: hypothetical protein PGN37_24025 [Mycobacterium kyogaense]|uniref:hypothetical protein n=1 Tax=Mycobacterium kyogaense TaxID=2212479 RepID=UPI002FF7A92E